MCFTRYERVLAPWIWAETFLVGKNRAGPEVPQGPVCWEGVLGRNLRKKRSPEDLGNGQSHRIYILKVNSPAVEQTPKDLDGGLLGSLEPQNGFMFGIEALNLN